jgi:hypothetical protein
VPEHQAVNGGKIVPIRARKRAAIQHMTAKPIVPFSPSTFSAHPLFSFFSGPLLRQYCSRFAQDLRLISRRNASIDSRQEFTQYKKPVDIFLCTRVD